jgi:hypothetical protein
MPDAVQIEDPFSKPSLKKEVVTIAWNTWAMEVRLPGLGENFTVTAINDGNAYNGLSKGASISVKPGVYLLKNASYTPSAEWGKNTRWNDILLGEFVAPEAHAKTFSVVHQPAKVIESGKSLQIEAQIVGPSFPDSVIIYTDKVSFWSDKNPSVKMKRIHGYTYGAEIPAGMINKGLFRYNIIVYKDNKNYTYPAKTEGNPLDWDYTCSEYWESAVVRAEDPLELLKITDEYSDVEAYGIPETSYVLRNIVTDLTSANSLKFRFKVTDAEARFFWRKYIKNYVSKRKDRLEKSKYLCVNLKNTKGITKLNLGFVTSDGFTYTSVVNLDKDGLYKVSLSDLRQVKTALLPSPYPTFLERYFEPDTQIPFAIEKIEMLEMSTVDDIINDATLDLGSVWLE